MRNGLIPAAVAALLAWPPAAWSKAIDSSVVDAAAGLEAERDTLAHATTEYQNNDLAGALELLKEVIAAPTFSQLDTGERHSALMLAGYASVARADSRAALGFLKQASIMDEATGLDWHQRLHAAYQVGDRDDAVFCLKTIAQRWPTSLSQVSSRSIFSLLGSARVLPDGRERWFDLAQALYDANWQVSEASLDTSGVWAELARVLIAKGQMQHAAAVAERVGSPYEIIAMIVDADFDPITRGDPGRFDPMKAMQRRIDALRAGPADRLETRNELARMLMDTGQDTAALALIDESLAHALPADGSVSPYVDAEDQVIWTMNNRSTALRHLGRNDEAVAQMETAARRPEHGMLNISQTINLAGLLATAGRPQDALKEVADLSPRNLSPYGVLAAENARAMAYAELHDQPALAKSITIARAHSSDAPGALLNMLLMANDLDGAANFLIAQLSDPERRPWALVRLQDWRDPPNASDFVREIGRRLDAVRDRPDVRAAIAKVGRIQKFDLYAG